MLDERIRDGEVVEGVNTRAMNLINSCQIVELLERKQLPTSWNTIGSVKGQTGQLLGG